MSGEPALETAIFTAAGGLVPRRFDEYASGDVVNAKNMGAKGDGVTDDYDALMATFRKAFTDSPNAGGTPNGLNTSLNKAVFIPSGAYLVRDELVLPPIKRGLIKGAVSSGIGFLTPQTSKRLFRINGMEDTLIENVGFALGGSSSCVGIDLDWDGTGSIGLSHNSFSKVSVGATNHTTSCTGYRIANSGHGGAGNSFWNCISEFINIGFHVVGANADGQVFEGICGGSESTICWKVDGGSISKIAAISNAGTNVQLDVQINNASTVQIEGVRSEASWFLELNASGAKAIVAGASFGSSGHSGTQQNIKMAPGTTLIMDVINTYAIVATSPGTTPKPIIYRRGGSLAVGFSPSSSDFTFAQNV